VHSGEMDTATALRDKLAEIDDQMGQLEARPDDQGSISLGKRVGEGTSMAVDRLAAVSAHDQLLAMLEEVRRARQHLAEGSYGVCEVCGEPIPEARLEVRPWAVRCVQHS